MPIFHVVRNTPGLPDRKAPPDSWSLRPDPLADGPLQTAFVLGRVDERGDERRIGLVRIATSGQERGRTTLPLRFEAVTADTFSLGAEIDYYSELREIAGPDSHAVLLALGDVAIDPDRRARFAEEFAFRQSLVRYAPSRSALEGAGAVLSGVRAARSDGWTLAFYTAVGGEPLELDLEFGADPDLPGEIVVLVGPNGSGKTRLLANLALATFAPSDVVTWGRLDTKRAFSRILALSYSALDEFDVPGGSARGRSGFIRAGVEAGYSYLGLRDLEAGQEVSAAGVAPLKSADRIRVEFEQAFAEGLALDGLLREALAEVLEESSFTSGAMIAGEDLDDLDDRSLTQTLQTFFASASTGHKFVLLMVAQLCANVRPQSLVLVDEPEAHLHPPLLATFLRALRRVLRARDANAVVATHSPFLVQETPARYVRVINRRGPFTTVRRPVIETFGEDIGTITREVFQLDSSRGEYVEILEELSRLPVAEVEAKFDPGLSGQARSLVLTAQRRRGRP